VNLTSIAPFQLSTHESASVDARPTIEKYWIKHYAPLVHQIEMGEITVKDAFGPFIPIFVEWSSLYRHNTSDVHALHGHNTDTLPEDFVESKF